MAQVNADGRRKNEKIVNRQSKIVNDMPPLSFRAQRSEVEESRRHLKHITTKPALN